MIRMSIILTAKAHLVHRLHKNNKLLLFVIKCSKIIIFSFRDVITNKIKIVKGGSLLTLSVNSKNNVNYFSCGSLLGKGTMDFPSTPTKMSQFSANSQMGVFYPV
jgi:hypothetical protein